MGALYCIRRVLLRLWTMLDCCWGQQLHWYNTYFPMWKRQQNWNSSRYSKQCFCHLRFTNFVDYCVAHDWMAAMGCFINYSSCWCKHDQTILLYVLKYSIWLHSVYNCHHCKILWQLKCRWLPWSSRWAGALFISPNCMLFPVFCYWHFMALVL